VRSSNIAPLEGSSADREAAGPERQRIVALSRGLRILSAFEQAAGPLSNQELVAFTGLPKSTVSRLTRTLTIEGFLIQLPRTAQFQLSPAMVGLARAYHHSTGVAELSRPHMEQLALEIRGTVAVAARDGFDMVYLSVARNVSRVDVPQSAGSRVPVPTTASGLAYLHALPSQRDREALLASLRARSPHDAPKLEHDVERTGREIERHGFCVCAGTWRADMNGVGAALVLPEQTVIAFTVGGPTFWFKEDWLYREVGPRLFAMVRNVEADISRRRGGAR
jgi:DNA-binding IclR family transcriptional regulator